MPGRELDWAPGVIVLDGQSVPPRCATDWGNGHRCGRIADHKPGHHCAACSRTWGHDPPRGRDLIAAVAESLTGEVPL